MTRRASAILVACAALLLAGYLLWGRLPAPTDGSPDSPGPPVRPPTAGEASQGGRASPAASSSGPVNGSPGGRPRIAPSPATGIAWTAFLDSSRTDWLPDPEAPLAETVDRFLSSSTLFLPIPQGSLTGGAAVEFLRSRHEEVLELLREDVTEQGILDAYAERIAQGPPRDGRDPAFAERLHLLGLLGSAEACEIAAARGRFMQERRRDALAEIHRLVKEEHLRGGSPELQRIGFQASFMDDLFTRLVEGATYGRCPDLRELCRELVPVGDGINEMLCARYLAWLFPNEPLPPRVSYAAPWPDPPYWTPPPGKTLWPAPLP